MKKMSLLMCRLGMLFIFSFIGSAAWGTEPTMLTRDEVSVLKKKLIAVAAALGQAPAGYTKTDEQFQLPTDAYEKDGTGKFNALTPSMSLKFTGGGEKQAKKTQKQLQQEYEKRMAEAVAKGNYQEIAKLSEELQKKAGEAHLAEVSGRKDPIEIEILLNTGANQALDADMVVFEKPGVIGVITDNRDEQKQRIVVLFDPVALRETKTLSRADLNTPKDGVAKKTAVVNASVELVGPAAEITAWAQQIDTGAVLRQIDEVR